MSLPDEAMPMYYELLLDWSREQADKLAVDLEGDS